VDQAVSFEEYQCERIYAEQDATPSVLDLLN
jgi:hypothetical protein